MRQPDFSNITKRLRDRDQRGAALVEFAIAIPILVALLAIIFDAGLGYSAARSSSSAARSAARIGALAGADRDADFRALEALKIKFGDGSTVNGIYIYRSQIDNLDGLPPGSTIDVLSPDGCRDDDYCNFYNGADLASLSIGQFAIDSSGAVDTCASGSPDEDWCPLDREADKDSYLGVLVESTSRPTIGAISPDEFKLIDRAVFALYFPPNPAAPPTN